jgi:hypothetical protein
MAILDDMLLLVSDLEAAFSHRLEGEKERLETAASDAQDRAMGTRELRATAAENARERLQEISRRSSEIADMMDIFFQVRTAESASDAHDRATADRERRAEAANEARARMAEFRELSGIWRGHAAVIGGLGAGAPRMPVRTAAQPPHRSEAPSEPPEAAKPPAPAKAPKAPKAKASTNSET